MYESFGAVVTKDAVEFRLFFPDNHVDAQQYTRGGDPQIAVLRVCGDFQNQIGGVDWNPSSAPEMQGAAHPHGYLYTLSLPLLPDGFYQYKYFVTFQNGTTRWCSDPCTKYGGSQNQNAGFVVGGNVMTPAPISQRLPLPDLVAYELMLDDFTAQYRQERAPLDAVADKIPHLLNLGVNAIEFMPWTAWPDDTFNWGYLPTLFFSVENRYTQDAAAPLDKLYKLQTIVDLLHRNHLHVLMDGVFEHVNVGTSPDQGFPYYWLYQDPGDSPYTDANPTEAFGRQLDYTNNCTQDFIFDVCRYWLDAFRIDGIRFDYVRGYYSPSSRAGITQLIAHLNQYAQQSGQTNLSLILELLTDNRYDAIHDTNEIGATGCWFDPLLFDAFACARNDQAPSTLVRSLNAAQDFAPGRVPATYIENHDHSTLANVSGGRGYWYKAQPLAMVLLTVPGGPLIHNGQEFAADFFLPDSGDGRVVPRPLDWAEAVDSIGVSLGGLYRRLVALRLAHPVLRSPNFYPAVYDQQWTQFNDQGYGVDTFRGLIIYHRWGTDGTGRLERFIIALNVSEHDQVVTIPFSDNGDWQELLSETTATVQNYRLDEQTLSSHWGRIYLKAD